MKIDRLWNLLLILLVVSLAGFFVGSIVESDKLRRQYTSSRNDNSKIAKYTENPVLTPSPGAWDSVSVANPMVAIDPKTGNYVMIYAGWNDSAGSKLFGLAMSKDGLKWKKYNRNPVLKPSCTFDEDGFEGGSLIYRPDLNEWWLYYTGIKKEGDVAKYRTMLAVSKDLKHWEKQGVILNVGEAGAYDEVLAGEPAVMWTGTKFRMIYTAMDANRTLTLACATSLDGKQWNKCPENPIFRGSSNFFDRTLELRFLTYYNGWHILLFEAQGTVREQRFWKTGIAFTEDYRAWGRPSSPILQEEVPSYGSRGGNMFGVVSPYLASFNGGILLYDTLVRKSGKHWWVGNTINVAFLAPDVLNPASYPELFWDLWHKKSISTKGATTPFVIPEGHSDLGFYLITNQDGTVTVEVDPINIPGDAYVLDIESLRAGTLWSYRVEYGARRIRVKFTPVAPATVSAFAVSRK